MKRVSDVLRRRHGVLSTLSDESARREALNALLVGFLDQPFRDHVQVARIKDGTVVLCADSPTWGHRVRYLAPSILDHLRKKGVQGLEDITISVPAAPPAPAPTPAARTPAPLSKSSVEVLRATAAEIGNPELARRLEAIAQRATRGKKGADSED